MATITRRGQPIRRTKKQAKQSEFVTQRQVKQLIGLRQQLNAVDTQVLTTFDAGGQVVRFVHPTQGDGVSERNGDEIILKRLRFHLQFTSADTTNLVRFIIFRWSPDNSIPAVPPGLLDVLQTQSAAAQYNFTHQRANQVHIVYDKMFVLNANSTPNKAMTKVLYGAALGKKKLVFDAALTTGVDQFYYLLLSDSVGAPHPGVGGTIRLEYTDS